MASLGALRDLPNLQYLCPGHGPVIENPIAYIDAYINGRHARDRQILDVLAQNPEMTTWAIMEQIYADLNLVPRLQQTLREARRPAAECPSGSQVPRDAGLERDPRRTHFDAGGLVLTSLRRRNVYSAARRLEPGFSR